MRFPFKKATATTDQMPNELLLKLVTPNLMRKIRTALGLSQEQMANLIGVSRQMVNYYEGAYACPSADTWVKWIEVVEKQIRKLRSGAKELEQG